MSMSLAGELRLIPIPFAPEIAPGHAVAEKLLHSLRGQRLSLRQGDILVIKHKIVSKAEGGMVDLATIRPSEDSVSWAQKYGLDARVVELALGGGGSVVRRKNGVLITETSHGFVCANSGVDVSNVDGGRHAALLPKDPDRFGARAGREFRN